MELTFEGFNLYRSSFDPATGTLVRETEVTPPGYDGFDQMLTKGLPWMLRRRVEDKWRKKYDRRREAFSPSPETVDIAITNWCNFGCDFCYQDSVATNKHAPKDLVPRVLKSFTHVPYQIAIGGGEPTAHPDFPEILHSAKALGTVPNYTTAGHIFREDVIEATNAVCGGVAMTYHAQKGLDWFVEHYAKLRSALRVQLNVHVIADRDAPAKIDQLVSVQDKIGRLNIVLLAYYPDVGRGNMQGLITKNAYNALLPAALRRAIAAGAKIAFSEGLLPYFISRPEIGVDTMVRIGSMTSEVTRAEGLFSCYVDSNGRMSQSSFNPPPTASDFEWTEYKKRYLQNANRTVPDAEIRKSYEGLRKAHPTVYETCLQTLWNRGWYNTSAPRMVNCDTCVERSRCATPNPHHYFICAYSEANGNNPPLPPALMERQRLQKIADDLYDLAEIDRASAGVDDAAQFLKARGWYDAMDAVSSAQQAERKEKDAGPNIRVSRYWQRRVERSEWSRRLQPTGKRKKRLALLARRREKKSFSAKHVYINKKAVRQQAAWRKDYATSND